MVGLGAGHSRRGVRRVKVGSMNAVWWTGDQGVVWRPEA